MRGFENKKKAKVYNQFYNRINSFVALVISALIYLVIFFIVKRYSNKKRIMSDDNELIVNFKAEGDKRNVEKKNLLSECDSDEENENEIN